MPSRVKLICSPKYYTGPAFLIRRLSPVCHPMTVKNYITFLSLYPAVLHSLLFLLPLRYAVRRSFSFLSFSRSFSSLSLDSTSDDVADPRLPQQQRVSSRKNTQDSSEFLCCAGSGPSLQRIFRFGQPLGDALVEAVVK